MNISAILGASMGLHGLTGLAWLVVSLYVAIALTPPISPRLRKAQAILAVLVAFFGLVLWRLLHAGAPGPRELVLILGVLCAIAAAGLQHGMAKANERRMRALGETRGDAYAALARKVRLADRISTALLIIALATMLGARGV